MKTKKTDLIGKRFGKLTIIEVAYQKDYRTYLRCKCDCGKEKIILRENITRGLTRSCGCYKKNNSLNIKYPNYTRLWNIWYGIKRRCFCNKEKSYKFYGAKGITVCDEWKNDFMTFYKWAIENGYEYGENIPRLTIERKNVYGNYEPSNCCWKEYKEQMLNTTRNHRLLYKGKNMTIKEISQDLGIEYMELYNSLIRNDFDLNKALEHYKNRRSFHKFKIKNKIFTIRQVSELIKEDYEKTRHLYYRIGEQKFIDYVKEKIN